MSNLEELRGEWEDNPVAEATYTIGMYPILYVINDGPSGVRVNRYFPVEFSTDGTSITFSRWSMTVDKVYRTVSDAWRHLQDVMFSDEHHEGEWKVLKEPIEAQPESA